ncbi:MAG TPA: hypothetical protein VMC03_02550 [Streptosporangiaceae bacterium]|nr:hypothetical protein [Streptosporangiaceae bacterium]
MIFNAQSAAESGISSAGLVRRRAALGAVAMAGVALAAVTGCSSGGSTPAASSSPSTTTPATQAAAPAVPTTPVATTPAAPPSPPPTQPPAAAPTLGQPAGVFAHGSAGFGQVKPAKIFNGGDPTGLVTNVVWSSWGGTQATATGTSDYVGPNQSVAQGTEESATVVAFNLGTCDGKLMYQAVEWYFPQHGQAFNPNQYENICTGTYVGQ